MCQRPLMSFLGVHLPIDASNGSQMRSMSPYFIFRERESMGSVLLSIKQLKKVFPVQRGIFGKAIANLQALADISMQIDQGEIVGLVGESGCGKSTLGRCIVALEKPSAGEVLWEGASPFEMNPAEKKKNRKNYQMVFQNPFASLNPRQSIKNLLLEPLEVHGLFEPRKQISWVMETLIRVGFRKKILISIRMNFPGGNANELVWLELLLANRNLSSLTNRSLHWIFQFKLRF